ncbi:MAG: M23 family metallopeptidase [Acidimicrobiales bacterium]
MSPAAVLALAALAVASSGVAAHGQLTSTTTTPTTTSEPEPTTTTAPAPPPEDTVPPPPPDTAPPAGTAPTTVVMDQPPAPTVDQGDGSRAPAPGEVPDGARRAINSVRRSAPNGTARLLAALAPLEQLGMTHDEAISAGFGRFPVAGPAKFSHDWLYPRYTPEFHLHQGTDIFAVTGTPVRSPADGTLKLAQGGSGGLAAYVYQADGTYYYMAHLSAFSGQKQGQKVKLGEVVGYVGDSGNARGGSPHVHFEIHPAPARAVTSGKGKSRTVTYVARPVPVGTVLPAADPKATLDQWLLDALAAVPQLVAALESRPRALVATGITRRLADGRTGSFPGPVAPPATQLLWASSVNPSGGALRLAEAEAMVAATEFNWAQASRRQQILLQEQADAQARAAAILAPITPPSLLPPTANDT